jgi:chaperonin cofactor prefoldin
MMTAMPNDVALILSIFVFATNEVVTNLNNRIKSLEKRLNELENKQ